MIISDFQNAIPLYEKDTKLNKSYIYLTGGGFIDLPIIGTGVDSKYGWQELVWKQTPSRSTDFAFSDMDNIDVGLVARCEFNVKYMNIHDYENLRKILGRERHFKAKFFDIESNKWAERDMYCSENTVSKFFSLKRAFVGVLDYTIKLVGTNRDSKPQSITVSYSTSTDILPTPAGEETLTGKQLILADFSDDLKKQGYVWKDTDTQGNTIGQYEGGQSVTLWYSLNLVLGVKENLWQK